MSTIPEDEPLEGPAGELHVPEQTPHEFAAPEPGGLSMPEPPLFQNVLEVDVRPPARIPHLGNLVLVLALFGIGLTVAWALILIALHFKLYGISTIQGTLTDIHYSLGSELISYLVTFAGCLFFFPMFWHKGFFAGIQWNGATALRLWWRLGLVALVCFSMAILNMLLVPGPSKTPIEEIFREPGAAWLLFAFGISFAPFFEEIFFRGFLLPSLCTACDWVAEKLNHAPRRPLGENGHPQWSISAMAIAAILTSVPFAWVHAAQTGYSLGPFVLLVGVSLVLCTVRLYTRSLASSVLVHICYNFLIFTVTLVFTGGFRHLEKL
jgi:hypothetical protein